MASHAVRAEAEHKEIARRWVDEVFNGKEYDVLDEICTDGFVQHGPVSWTEWDAAEARAYLEGVHGAFPDAECVEEACIAEDEYVASFYTYSGTHEGEFMGIEPTDEELSVHGMILSRFEDGQIAELWSVVDFYAMMQQLGLAPGTE